MKEYARKNEKVIYIEADATISNAKSVLEEIWEALGNKNKEPERYLKKGIVEALSDSGFLIIIDESQHLTLKAMDIIYTTIFIIRIFLKKLYKSNTFFKKMRIKI